MTFLVKHPKVRRYGFAALVVLAVGLLTSVGVVIFSDDPLYDPDELFDTGVLVNPDKQPNFVFPEDMRTADLSLNRFIDRFFRLCAQGKYPEVRLMLSQRAGDALPPNRFENIFNAMKEARIKSIIRLPTNGSGEESAFVLTAEYDLEAHALRTQKEDNRVRMLIRKEEGEWRLGPVSREIAARLDALSDATTDSNGNDGDSNPDVETPKPSKVIANRPVRIEPEDE